MLSINPKKKKKTNVMTFQKRVKKCTEPNFHIGNEPVEIVQN